jgi:hypothetical protein
MSRIVRFGFLVCGFLMGGGFAEAQMPSGWQWATHGTVFAGENYQYRKFTDFQTLESQNWVMVDGTRDWARGDLRLTSMISLEPFTLKKIGSPQVFQTGETFDGAPLVDYQHPHDLFTTLGGSYSRGVGLYRISIEAAVVGSPALGPEPFMHRPSAAENPQAPLSHHNLDSTHITPGVITGGISRGAVGLESSWFRGREPDERRTDLDLGALDSWAVRGRWNRPSWNAQVSGGHLHNPEVTEPGRNIVRLTASAGYQRTGDVATALFGAWGQNREAHGNLNAFLFESTVTWLAQNSLYSRAEVVTKDILNAGGYDPLGFLEPHPLSRVGAFTLGYTRDLTHVTYARVGIGGDLTAYYVPKNLQDSYGGPVSMHLFVRIHFSTAEPSMEGMHHH